MGGDQKSGPIKTEEHCRRISEYATFLCSGLQEVFGRFHVAPGNPPPSRFLKIRGGKEPGSDLTIPG